MSGGSAQREYPTDAQCGECGLYYSSSGIIMHQAYCDGSATPKDPTPQRADPLPQDPPARPPQPAQPAAEEPPAEAAEDPLASGGETGPPAQAVDTCPHCGEATIRSPEYVQGQERGLLQTEATDRLCVACGVLVETDGSTEELVPQ